jgi:four helix bundle protein
MSRIRSYKDLLVWQKGVDLAVDLYGVTRRFPSFERFAVSSQIQRSGVSIPSNVAEGHSKSTRSFLNHLDHSTGSLSELETLLLISHRVDYLKRETYQELAERTDEIGRMLGSLSASVAASAGITSR